MSEKTFKFYGVDNNFYKLDNTVWEAVEDPSDGYRSYLDSIEEKINSDKLIFFSEPLAEVKVIKSDDNNIDGYSLIDTKDGWVWLRIGTYDYDDYYPCFRFEYNPKPVKTLWEDFIS